MLESMITDLAKINDTQYQIIAARRQSYDNMMWQTPLISLTGQAFIFAIALGSGGANAREIASILALLIAFSSAHLLSKHRSFEVYYSQLLQDVEAARGIPQIHEKPTVGGGLVGISAYKIWVVLFGVIFPMVSASAFILAWRS